MYAVKTNSVTKHIHSTRSFGILYSRVLQEKCSKCTYMSFDG